LVDLGTKVGIYHGQWGMVFEEKRGTKDVGRGTWDVGRGTWDVGRGTWLLNDYFSYQGFFGFGGYSEKIDSCGLGEVEFKGIFSKGKVGF
jgi:hypothetical protein